MNLLITGGCGFLGSNLAARALERGDALTVFDNLQRYGSAENLSWLRSRGVFTFINGDIRDREGVTRLVRDSRPGAIFHLAGQVAMTTSIDDPRGDFEINAMGTLNVLEAARLHAHDSAIVYSSTNKVYGDLEQFRYRETETRYECAERPNGFDESTPLEFQSPYGCSKGAADQYMLDYARVYGLKTIVFRHSSMYGGRQFATYDQGWIGWFCQKAIEAKRGAATQPFTISGNGKQVRDVLHADDMVSLYYAAITRTDAIKGLAFNIGGGMQNSLSLLELFSIIEGELGISLRYVQLPPRKSDQRVFVADTGRASRMIEWTPLVSSTTGVARMLAWTSERT